jgi:hypothetical protein
LDDAKKRVNCPFTALSTRLQSHPLIAVVDPAAIDYISTPKIFIDHLLLYF